MVLVHVLTCKLWQHALGKLFPFFFFSPLLTICQKQLPVLVAAPFRVFMVAGFLTALEASQCGHPLPRVALLVSDNITKLNFTLWFVCFFSTELARILPQAVQNDCQRILMQNLDDDTISLGLKCSVEMACVQ